MRKMALLLVFWVCFSAWTSTLTSLVKITGAHADIRTGSVFVLPASLKEIGEEAFEGTSVETVIFPDSLYSINDRAFADNNRLKVAQIPASVTYIGDHAFDGSLHLTIYGAEYSYASAWAQAHQVPFAQMSSAYTWITKLGKLLQGSFILSLGIGWVDPRVHFWRRRKTENRERSMRPQDRPELYPIDYRFP